MFRIECFCDDKKLVATLKALNGLVINLHVQPAAAEVRNGKARGVGTAIDRVRLAISTGSLGHQFAAADLAAILTKGNFSPKTVGSIVTTLVADKTIRRLKEKGKYEVRQ